MAMNLYHESRGEPVMGQYAVALVTLNRAKHDKDKVCQEVFKRKQFSWANGKATKVKGGWRVDSSMTPRDEQAWWIATRIAATALAGKMPDFTKGSRFYHTKAVKPIWRLAMRRTKTIGNHHFYALPE